MNIICDKPAVSKIVSKSIFDEHIEHIEIDHLLLHEIISIKQFRDDVKS